MHLASVLTVVLLGAACVIQVSAYGWLLSPVVNGSRLDSVGRPVAPDFRAFYSAAHFLHEGEPEAAYDYGRTLRHQRELFGESTNLLPWRYPPSTLPMVWPLGGFSYSQAYSAWVVAGLGALLLVVYWITRRGDLAIASLLSPSLAYTLLVGQIGVFLVAALLLGVGLRRRAPRVAGVGLGALILKPQMALMVPAFLGEPRARRLVLGIVACAAAWVGVSLALYGVEPWRLFLAELGRYGGAMLSERRPQWDRIPSVYVLVRELGAGASLARALQGLAALGGLLVTFAILRRSVLPDSRLAAIVCATTLLASPYVADYDLVILLAPALLWLREHPGLPTPWEALGLYGLVSVGSWLGLAVGAIGLQVGPLAWIALLVWGVAGVGPAARTAGAR